MTYTQGVQKIEVVVRKQIDGAQAAPAGTKEAEAPASPQTENKGDGASGGAAEKETEPRRMSSRTVLTNVTHSIATARQIGNLALQYYTSGLADKHGDEAYQQMVERKIEIANDAASIGISTVMGIVYGSRGGPVGAAVGAVTMGGSATASVISKYATRRRDYNYKMFREENGIEYLRARASINLTAGRLR